MRHIFCEGDHRIQTHFVNEKAETIADTNDGNNEVYVVRKQNEGVFIQELMKLIRTGEDLDPEKNKELGNKYGYNIENLSKHAAREHPAMGGRIEDDGFFRGYNTGYENDWIRFIGNLFSRADDPLYSRGSATGDRVGRPHKKEKKMDMFKLKLKNKRASNFIKVTKLRQLRRTK